MRFLVIIPTYKEKENIGEIITCVLGLNNSFHVLVIDDGSPDGTADIVKKLILVFPNKVFLIERPGKLGIGTAYITGFKWALENNFDIIAEMDADFSHPYKKLLEFENTLSSDIVDVIIGSRYVTGGSTPDWTIDRKFLSLGGSVYTKLITGMPIQDTTAGFIAYKRKVLEDIDLNEIKSNGYVFQIEMKFAAWKLGFKIQEIPIIFKDRIKGVSKMNGQIIIEALYSVAKLSLENIRGRFIKRIQKK
ncbi:MAG: polyprenol monophosphomannose synthase [Chitinophagaceae bacterium]